MSKRLCRLSNVNVDADLCTILETSVLKKIVLLSFFSVMLDAIWGEMELYDTPTLLKA